MPSVSKKQHGFMAAIANNPKFARKVGVSKSVGEEFMKADKGRKFKEGGLKETDAESNPGLAKLPTEVRNKMGYMKKGGMAHEDMSKDKPMMKKIAGLEATKVVNKHEKLVHKMAKGGVTRADGCATKGKTKGKMITMKKGGAC
jgi:hypothetical protein